MSGLVSEIRFHPGSDAVAGRPTLFINGEPVSGLSYMTYKPEAPWIREFYDAGCRLYFFSCTPDDCIFEASDCAWTAPDVYDYSQFDARIALFREQAPDAFFIPRVYMTSPPWWDAANPDELVVFDDGTLDKPPHIPTAKKRSYPSMASEKWREATVNNLTRFLRYIEEGPHADRIAGYHIASQHTEEWFAYWIYQDYFGDYSAPGRRAWAVWLRERYASDTALRAAWGRNDVSLEDPPLPTGDARRSHYRAEFREMPKERSIVDYALFQSDLTAETLNLFARTAKSATEHRKVIGSFYGYLLQFAEHAPVSGHLAARRVFAMPELDFFTSPSCYINQELGTGYGFFMAPAESVRAQGKLWFDENDIWTSVMLRRCGDQEAVRKLDRWDPWKSRQLQRRELGNAMGHGAAMWWFDMFAGWYSGDGHMEEIERMLAWGEALRDEALAATAEVLLVVDGEAMAAQGFRTLLGPCLSNLVVELGHLGAPFDVIELGDLERVLEDRYRFVIFANAWSLSAAQRETIAAAVYGGGRTVLWLYSPGAVPVFGEETTDAASRCRELTGFDAERTTDAPVWPGLAPVKTLTAEGARRVPFLLRWQERCDSGRLDADACPRTLSSEAKPAPLRVTPVRVDESGAVVLARDAEGRAGLLLREFGGGVSVLATPPILTHPWLRAIAAAAGVHLFLDTGDTIYANDRILCVAAALEDGPRTIRLPSPAMLWDIVTAETLDGSSGQVQLGLRGGECRVFEIRSAES